MPRYCRLKANYTSARAAWRSIARKTGLDPGQVSRTDHTSSHYCWIIPNP